MRTAELTFSLDGMIWGSCGPRYITAFIAAVQTASELHGTEFVLAALSSSATCSFLPKFLKSGTEVVETTLTDYGEAHGSALRTRSSEEKVTM
jgi:hypothetical protein